MAQVTESRGHMSTSDPLGENHFLYVYEGEPAEEVERLLDHLGEEEEVTVNKEDASRWTEEERWDFYLERLIPLAFHNRKDLREKVEAQESGTVTLKESVLLTGESIYIGKEEQERMLKEELGIEA